MKTNNKSASSLVFGIAISISGFSLPAAANFWTDGGSDNLWSNADNWSLGVAPLSATNHPEFGWDDPALWPLIGGPLTPDTSDDGPQWNNNARLSTEGATILIDSNVDATAYGVRIGWDGDSNTLEMTGGSLQIGGTPPSGGDVVGWHFDVGRGINRSANPNPLATFNMSGGEVRTNGLLIPESFVDETLADPYDTPGVNGHMSMSGGTITARWMNVGQFTGNGSVELSGDAVINLWPDVASNPNNGGHFEMKRNWFIQGQAVATVADASLDISGDAVINIFGHQSDLSMAPDQGEVDRMQQYVDDGWLTANNGTANPIFTLQDCPDDGSFDEFCLSGMMITVTAPEQSVNGDFNTDGSWDCADIDALVAEIAAGTNDVSFDMTGDGFVDTNDINDAALGWLTVGGANSAATGGNPFLAGDGNLDGFVDVSDLNIWNGTKFTSDPAWCSGDFNADGFVDVSDLNIWSSNKFQSSDLAAVPEPDAGVLLFAVVWFVGWKCRRSPVCR